MTHIVVVVEMHNPSVSLKYDPELGLAHLSFIDQADGSTFDRVINEHEVETLAQLLRQAQAKLRESGAEHIRVFLAFDTNQRPLWQIPDGRVKGL